ncbi:HEAT repeat domain-containing protein [Streptomyces sp. BI20]|uniref:HEAT repeat domain-containing protein n=1 Tax=Streptomyces sp. BI20 TaxID=3403460 RepID=UPI003C7350BD
MDVAARWREEAGPQGEALRGRLTAAGPDALAAALTESGLPLWARELAAHRLGLAADPRAFEPLVLFLNHRDPERGAAAADALAHLGDPRTGRAAAALARNELRVAYALHPVRLLVRLRAPEAAPALIAVLDRRLAPHDPYHRIATACVLGLAELADPAAREVLTRALAHPRLAADAARALRALPTAPAGT